MKMSFFCIHGFRLLLLIILLFIKQRKQVIAVNCLFCKMLKRKCSQTKILKLLSFAKFHCASNDICLRFLRSSWTFYRRKRHQYWQKSHSKLIFCNFLNRVRTQLPNLRQLQYVTNTLCKFQTNRTNRLFVVSVRVNRGQIYIINNLKWREIRLYLSIMETNQQYFRPLLPWAIISAEFLPSMYCLEC